MLEINPSEEIKLPPSTSTKFTSPIIKSLKLQEEKFKYPPDPTENTEEEEITPLNSISEREKITFSSIEIFTPSEIKMEEGEEVEREMETGEDEVDN